MIILHQPPPAWGLQTISPFCLKVETYFRMAKIDYKTAPPDVLKVAPNGRVPYVDIDGKILGDSTLIISEMKRRFGDPLDGALSKEQKAQSLMIQRLIENHLYFASAWFRFSEEESWNYIRDYFKAQLPPFIGRFIVKIIRKDALRIFKTQGIGEHSNEQILEFAKADLTALSDWLGEKPFFLGDKPTTVDASAYGQLVQLIWVPWNSALKQHALGLKNLVQYCERMKQRFG
jgi:glutathione S-transferase